MSQNFIGPPKHPHFEAWRLAQSQLIMVPSKRVDAALLTAVVVRASNGRAFFCKLDNAYKPRLLDVTKSGDVMAAEFLKAATAWEGPNRGKVAKYQYHARCLETALKFAEQEGAGHLRAVVYACSWGISQQPGFRIVESVDVHMRKEYFARYLGDQEMQMRQLIQRLDNLIFQARGGIRTALQAFYSDTTVIRPFFNVDRTMGLAEHYRGAVSQTGSISGS